MAFFKNLNVNNLTDVERNIYNYIINNVDKIPYMRVREIAKESNSSPSSVMRFVHTSGYDSFSEFKLFFKRKSTDIYKESDFEKGSDLLSRDKFHKDIELTLHAIAEQILPAENIIFFGMGGSGAICNYAARRLATIGYNTFALTDPTFPLQQKLKNTSDNVVIVLSITGNTSEVIEMISSLKRVQDFLIVGITSNLSSTLASISDYVLSYTVKTNHLNQYNDMTSQIPTMFLIESLVNEVLHIEEEHDKVQGVPNKKSVPK